MLISVSNSAELKSALSRAHAGDTISLKSGDYGALNLNGVKFASGDVTITSANPEGASFTVISLTNVQGLKLTNLDVESNKAGSAAIYVTGSDRVTFDRIDVHGNLDGNPTNDGGGFAVRNSTNVTISNSEVHDLIAGISHSGINGLTITGNQLHDISVDAISGTNSTNVSITKNFITNMMSGGNAHRDAIQFFTTGTTVPQKNILIADNVFVRGDGQVVQGIFMGDEAGVGYENVTITRNAIIGGAYHGITLDYAKNSSITDNLVVGYQDMQSWIRVVASTNTTVADNQATAYNMGDNVSVTMKNNELLDLVAKGDTNLLSLWQNEPGHINLDGGALKDKFVSDQGIAEVVPVYDVRPGLTVSGGGGGDAIKGDTGNDLIDGKGGADTMTGSYGDDTYVVDNGKDKIVEEAKGGTDTARITVSFYKLDANVENATLTGSATQSVHANDKGNVLTGNSVSSYLGGFGGNDTLISRGGDDTMWGGTGADVFRWEAKPAADTVILDFAPNSDILDLRPLLANYNGTDPIADGVLKFVAKDNSTQIWLDADGAKGPGAAVQVAHVDLIKPTAFKPGWNFLWSKDGNDTAAVMPPAVSTPTAPTPTAPTPGATPTSGTTVGGSGALNGTAGADSLYGGSGADQLDGKAGADLMMGGNGDDRYFVDNSNDRIVELGGGGIDTVMSTSRTYQLSAQIENVTLTGTGSAQSIHANHSNNVLTANTHSSYLGGWNGDDTLISRGGDDMMWGGLGRDTFRWDAIPRGDTEVLDFTRGQDVLDLDRLLGGYKGSDPVRDGYVKFTASGGDTLLYVDTDGATGPAGFKLVATIENITGPMQKGADWIF